MSVVLAIGIAAALANLWAVFDAIRHHARDRVLWVSLGLAGVACGFSTAPFLVPPAVYTAMAYLAVGHPSRLTRVH
jgi:hypothetical protein